MRNVTRHDTLVIRPHPMELPIADEVKRPLPNAFVLQRLKRQTRVLKDKIECWERLMSALRFAPAARANVAHA